MEKNAMMPDYEKMYALLCGAIDDVIDPLEKIPLARDCVRRLKAALLEAEEIYILTAPLEESTDPADIAKIDAAWDDWVENYAPEEDREAFREFTAEKKAGRHTKLED